MHPTLTPTLTLTPTPTLALTLTLARTLTRCMPEPEDGMLGEPDIADVLTSSSNPNPNPSPNQPSSP